MVYEIDEDCNCTWNAAVSKYSSIARVSSIEQLCDAQAELSLDSSHWTALRINDRDLFQWGLSSNNSVQVPLGGLLDVRQPLDRCYAISKSVMKLKSMDCNIGLPVLLSYNGEVHQPLNIDIYNIMNKVSII